MHFPILFLVVFAPYLLGQLQLVSAEKTYSTNIEVFQAYSNTGTEYFEPKTLRVTRKAKNTYVVTGNFSLNSNLGEEAIATYEVTKKSDTSDKYSTVMKGGENICRFCATNKNFYPRFRTFTNLPEPDVCPFPKGNYMIKDFTFDDKSMPLTVPYGIYIIKVSYINDNENLFGYTVQVRVSPA